MTTVLLFIALLAPLAGLLINGAVALFATPDANGTRSTARHTLVSIVGPGSIVVSFIATVALFLEVRTGLTAPLVVTLGSWMPVGDLAVDWSLHLDQLSMLMMLVVTGVGALIHLFSIGYMQDDPGYARYFAYLNLFVGFMLVLVLGGSYPVVFVGWEGVALASYLLIGFWFTDVANADAGKKAFVVNRVGDFGFLVAMFLIWNTTRRLDFIGAHEVLAGMGGSTVVLSIALFLFIGCVGKSAQLPLYIWLPDAMAGPTPVSALIHAATMVTAGVYLVARAAPIFSGAPEASLIVVAVGALTALFAAAVALKQWDIKRVLAYSTVSQLGYMFIAVGSGAYTAGVFHLVTHAFFKALLFLGAGSVIHVMHQAFHHTHRNDDPQDLRNMGGLAKYMPATATAMTLATLAIAGVPPLSGFFSKDEILSSVFARATSSPLAEATILGIPGSTVLYAAYGIGMITALITAVYMVRMLMYAFFGANRTGESERSAMHETPFIMTGPVLALAVLTVAGGWLNLPSLLPFGKTAVLEEWLSPVTGASALRLTGDAHLPHNTELGLVAAAVAVAILGLIIALVLYRKPIADKANSPVETSLLARACGVDEMIDAAVVQPVYILSDNVLTRGVDRGIDRGFTLAGSLLARTASFMGLRVQDGDLSRYIWVLAVGALALIAALTLK